MEQELPFLVVSDANGNVFELPPYRMTGMSMNTLVLPPPSSLIELPYGSNIFMLPLRHAIGYDPRTGQYKEITEYKGNPVFGASAFMAPAYMQLLRSAYTSCRDVSPLPLYSYTALGWLNGKFYVCGIRIDDDRRQDLENFDLDHIGEQAQDMKQRFKGNRLAAHLVDHCVCRYGCPAARNFVLERWECPLPTSPACNAACIGCISKQPVSSSIKASQDRILFIPEVDEIAEIAIFHLENAPGPVVSFGQGCEGEPLLAGDTIELAIRKIREHTSRGIINLNTNGSKPDVVRRLCKAGLDSIRVSLNSAQVDFYHRYYRPRDYSFKEIIKTLHIIREYGKWSSINYFIFPGFTDSEGEMDALFSLIKDTRINMIQTRNLNIDPAWYIEKMEFKIPQEKSIGLINWLLWVKKEFPWIKTGYFNPSKQGMKKEHFPV
ncbi:MAG: radical SAM protein [Spirochaetales bacterium]|nr:radical SAM protein [Spirochaetales bacterium]